MTRNKLLSLAFSSILTVAGCGSSSEASKEMTNDQAKANALALIPGTTAESVERESPAGEPALVVVKLKLANGAMLEVEYVAADSSLWEIKSDTAPFDGYDVTPRASVLKYSQAKPKAFETKAGNIEVWEFQASKSIWEFYIRDTAMHLWEVKLNAADGKLVSVAEKVKPD